MDEDYRKELRSDYIQEEKENYCYSIASYNEAIEELEPEMQRIEYMTLEDVQEEYNVDAKKEILQTLEEEKVILIGKLEDFICENNTGINEYE